jgi:hypothetical protein
MEMLIGQANEHDSNKHLLETHVILQQAVLPIAQLLYPELGDEACSFRLRMTMFPYLS